MTDKKSCSISLPSGQPCPKDAKHHVFFDNKDTGERIIDLHLCDEHGEQMRRTYFPTAGVPEIKP
jgi:hypothetical protein